MILWSVVFLVIQPTMGNGSPGGHFCLASLEKYAVETMVQNPNTKLLRISTVTVPFSQSWKTTLSRNETMRTKKRNMWLWCFYWWVKNTPSNRQKHGRIPTHLLWFLTLQTTAKLVYQCLTIVFRIVKNYNAVKTMINHPPVIPQSSPSHHQFQRWYIF